MEWRRKWLPIPVFLPGEFHGQWSLEDYSSWSHKESDVTETLALHTSTVNKEFMVFYCLWLHANLLQPCRTLHNPMGSSQPGSSIHGILQARILEWVPMPSSRRSSWPRDSSHTSFCFLYWQVGSLPLAPTGKPFIGWISKLLFRHVWLCDLMDCSLPVSSVHGILQARLLEWVAISFSRASSLLQGILPT